MNGTPGDPRTFDALHALLDDQCHRLAFWQTASDEINYRRFFDVNELAALSMEREEVFEAAHALVLRLLAEGKLDGLRIDHPDGLYDPAEYFARLQRHCRVTAAAEDHQPLYVVAEKILAMDEPLPEDWAVHGTSGYDFLNMVNGLFVDAASEEQFTRFYTDWSGESASFSELVYAKKRLILQTSLASELNMLAHQLDRLSQQNRRWRDFTLSGLHSALREVIACFPVYRCYACGEEVVAADRRHVELAIEQAIRRNPKTSPAVFQFIRDILLLRYPEDAAEELRQRQRRFVGKFQQLTAPVTAKGVEDTAFYVYNRLVSLNEVGGDPGHFGVPPDRLHEYLKERQSKWPCSLSALSTHDTKRSEDVRARINVLSEMPEEWERHARRWGEMNRPHRQPVDGAAVPHPNEEYLLYQTLVGAWPLTPSGHDEHESFVKRIQAYMLKALREAKVHTGWTNPNSAYEQAVDRFIGRIMDPRANRAFLDDFRTFQGVISHLGLLSSLSQTLLRITTPGVPDTYQGTELWDFSLVDPDNRRPVDYQRRARMLSELRAQVQEAGADRRDLAHSLLEDMADARIKLYVTWQALDCRRRLAPLFTAGGYMPLEAAGVQRDNVFAFARRHADQWALAVAPRLISHVATGPNSLPLGQKAWGDTALQLPGELARSKCRNVFTDEELAIKVTRGRTEMELAAVLSVFPVALFTTS